MRKLLFATTLGLAHGASDCAGGFLLGSTLHSLPLLQVGILVLIYNGLAFGSQPLLGWATDRLGQPRLIMIMGLLLSCLPLLTMRWSLATAVLFAGFGSALMHVGGGALTLYTTPDRASGPGLFVAPGVVGLAIGSALAITGYNAIWPILSLLLILALTIGLLKPPSMPYTDTAVPQTNFPQNGYELALILLITAVALRSSIWTTYQYLLDGQHEILLLLAIAAGLGKVCGGFLADQIGWRRWVVTALLLAAPLLSLSGDNLIILALGIILLQSTTPAALAAAGQIFPRQPATAVGLMLGLAVLLGGLPAFMGLSQQLSTPTAVVGVTAMAVLAFWLARHLQKTIAPIVRTN